jgi:hypothetical protein
MKRLGLKFGQLPPSLLRQHFNTWPLQPGNPESYACSDWHLLLSVP